MNQYYEGFYLSAQEPIKSTLLALRSIIAGHDDNISETVKYGMPYFLYKKNIMCYLWTDRKTGEPYILMAEGKYLSDPHLERGSRARMKILRIDPRADIPIRAIENILDQAIGLYTRGVVMLK